MKRIRGGVRERKEREKGKDEEEHILVGRYWKGR